MIALRKLAFGLALIAAAASVLLLSDLGSRNPTERKPSSRLPRVALVQNVSQQTLEDGVAGLLEGLRERGFVDGETMVLRRFNAEGDIATLNTIAAGLSDGQYDMILTVATPTLQAVAKANKAGKSKHVFALVTDPWIAGVGISRESPTAHPPHLVGYGTMQPVKHAFELARRMYPDLKRVGVVWNASETNSASQLKTAREVCAELGITLEENTVDNASGVSEAARALVARGVEALFVPGDTTVLVAADALAKVAAQGGIPAFSVIPPTAESGLLFDLGANYTQVGREAGILAGEILAGRDSSTVEIVNFVPETFVLNETVLPGLTAVWKIPPDLAAKADIHITAAGRQERIVAATPTPTPALRKTPANVHVIAYTQAVDVEEAIEGIKEGFVKANLIDGRDIKLKFTNAHNDMATVSSLIDAAVTDRADLIMTLSTPTLQAALRRAGDTPIVFTYCASGVNAGAGKSDTDHLPNVTGVQTQGAYDDMMKIIRQVLPDAKRIGTLFVPSEVNTVFHKDKFSEAAAAMGMEVIAVPAETSAEVPDAARALCNRGVDVVCQIPGNLTVAAFPGIARAVEQARIPLFGTQSGHARAGAAVTVARDYHDAGVDAALLAARVLRGASIADLPFETYSKNRIILNESAIQRDKLQIPASLREQANEVIPAR